MKGHMQDGKFHPHTDHKKGVRKSRDQQTKIEGVKIRKARTTTLRKLPDASIRNDNFSFRIDDGKIRLSLDDFMWSWHGEEDQLNGFFARMAGTGAEAWDDLVDGLNDAGITFEMLKPHLLKNLNGKLTPQNDDGLYSLSGDNTKWHLATGDYDGVVDGEFDHFNQEGDLNDDEEDDFTEEFWNIWTDPTYEEWLDYEGESTRDRLKDEIKKADNFEELDEAYKFVREDIQDGFHEFTMNIRTGEVSWKAVEAVKSKRDEKGMRTSNISKEIASGKQEKLR